MARDYLTQEELLDQARELGLDLSERTLKFYTTRGLVPKPEKKPFPSADGRVAYFHRDSLRRLRRIEQLKSQGFKLEQIRKLLDQKGGESLRLLGPAEEDWRRQVAFRYLHQQAGEEGRKARVEFLASVLGTDQEELLQKAARRYMARLLTPLIGETEAIRYVEEYFLGLSPRELNRRMERFRRWRDDEKKRDQQVSPLELLRRMTSDFMLGLVSATAFGDELTRVRQRIELRRTSLAALSEGAWKDPLLLDLARESLEQADRGLEQLEQARLEKDSKLVGSGLEAFQRASQQLAQILKLARDHVGLLEQPEGLYLT